MNKEQLHTLNRVKKKVTTRVHKMCPFDVPSHYIPILALF